MIKSSKSFYETAMHHKDGKIVIVQALGGSKHRVKKFSTQASSEKTYAETTDGARIKPEYCKVFSICDTIHEAQEALK